MAGIVELNLAFPRLETGSLTLAGEPIMLKIEGATDASAAIYPGSWIMVDSNGYEACPTAAASATHVVTSIRDAEGEILDYQALAADQSVDYFVEAYPIKGLVFQIQEDALVTPITDANAQGTYAKIVVGTGTETTAGKAIYGRGRPNILLDSDTVNASSTERLVQLLGLAPILEQRAYSATAGASPRIFRVKVIDAVAG